MNIPNEERQDFFKWLKKANDKKNNGFYANWKDNTLESPGDITNNEYETAIKYASSILKQIKFMKSVDISDEEFIKLLNSEG